MSNPVNELKDILVDAAALIDRVQQLWLWFIEWFCSVFCHKKSFDQFDFTMS